jgi:hypothetical protein
MSKNEGGKCISTQARLTETSNHSDSISRGFHTLLHILQNSFEILMTTIRGPRLKSPLNVNGKISCINTW